MNWVTSPNFVIGVRGGYRVQDQHDYNVTEEPRYNWTTTSNVGFLDVPASLQHGTGFTSIPSNFLVDHDQFTRAFFHADGTVYIHAGGEHQIKFGVQADRTGNSVLSGEARPRVTLRWGWRCRARAAPTATTRSAARRWTRARASSRRATSTRPASALFVQDAWTLNNRLTVNVGVRTEREQVPTYATGSDIPKFGLEFGFKDKLAPRVGAAYDLRGDGKTKVFGSWGYFYDFFKLELPRGSFGGDKWIEDHYTLDTYDWPNLLASSSCPPSCPGTFIRYDRLPSPVVRVGLDRAGPEADEERGGHRRPRPGAEPDAGGRRALRPQEAARGHRGHRAPWTPQGNEIYIIANPGSGLTALAYVNPNVALPRPKRDYDSVEFYVDKRFADNWSLRASYLWSRLYGNYPGLTQSDENGRTSPNVGRSWDYPAMMFKQDGTANFGPLPTDRPHQFKVQGIYQFDFGTAVGLNEYVSSGLPVTRELGILAPSNYPQQYLGRGSDGRTDTLSQTDIFFQHPIKLGGGRRLEFNFTVFNLFNQQAGISKYSTYQKNNGIDFNETAFYLGQLNFDQLISQQNIAKDPRFLIYNGFQAPVTARFGVKFVF